MRQFFGKYRGTVANNVDPYRRGRIQVKVPAVYGTGRLSWALPCTPYAGNGAGWFAIPPRDASIWVEFEGGDPDRPIWTGCFWDENESAPDSGLPDVKVLKTSTGKITLNDIQGSGGITIETQNGMKIVIDTHGIEITNGQGASLKLTGNQVSINNGALEVM
jgi:uncharacterized protein involved in type VI secretion and phage assembly